MMMHRITGIIFFLVAFCGYGWGMEKATSELDNLVRTFKENPAYPQITIQLLRELKREGKPAKEVLDRYFQTQTEADYYKEYNWVIVRDFVNDIRTPQLQYVFRNRTKFMQHFSMDDVFQKLDYALVSYLGTFYQKDQTNFHLELKKIRECGYEHYDVVYDYFYIREIKAARNAEDYFYKARKLFRYFPEDRQMIKEITNGALELIHDVSRLKVIQLWAGKTVESKSDFEAICNYVTISQRCGFSQVARKYAMIARNLAEKGDEQMKIQASRLLQTVN